MTETGTLILDQNQIKEKVNRLAYQLFEDFSNDKKIIIAGVSKNGFILAKHLALQFEKISGIPVQLAEIFIDKKEPVKNQVRVSPTFASFEAFTVVVVDDVLDSGRTLIYALSPFLNGGAKKIRTVVLADRSHKRFPISADFSGVSIATTLQEHLRVDMESGKEGVYLE